MCENVAAQTPQRCCVTPDTLWRTGWHKPGQLADELSVSQQFLLWSIFPWSTWGDTRTDGNGRDWGQVADHISIKMSEGLHASARMCSENHMGSKNWVSEFAVKHANVTSVWFMNIRTQRERNTKTDRKTMPQIQDQVCLGGGRRNRRSCYRRNVGFSENVWLLLFEKKNMQIWEIMNLVRGSYILCIFHYWKGAWILRIKN